MGVFMHTHYTGARARRRHIRLREKIAGRERPACSPGSGRIGAIRGGTVAAHLRRIEQRQEQEAISKRTATRYLKEMNFSCKRYRYRVGDLVASWPRPWPAT
jgi:hypothetical protein